MIHVEVQVGDEGWGWRVECEGTDREHAVAEVAEAIEDGEVICAKRHSAVGDEARFVRFPRLDVIVSAAIEPTVAES